MMKDCLTTTDAISQIDLNISFLSRITEAKTGLSNRNLITFDENLFLPFDQCSKEIFI